MKSKTSHSLPFELFLAWRYLKPKRTYVSVITIISILGVMLGVAVLIVVISVMSGFDRDFRDKIVGIDAHLTISNRDIMKEWKPLMEKIRKVPHVTNVSPFVYGLVLLNANDRVTAPKLVGIDEELEQKGRNFAQYVKKDDGEFSLEYEEIVVGKGLSQALGVFPGDRITVYSPASFEEMRKNQDEVHIPTELTVSGVFETGVYDYDHELGYVFVSLETAQELYRLNGGVHGLSVMTDDPNQAHLMKEQLNHILPSGTFAFSWMDNNQTLLTALKVERNVMFFVLFFIVIVAAFGIMSTLITVVTQKTKEIGVLKSLGASSKSIMAIFLLQSAVVGIVGTITGAILGWTVLQYRNNLLNILDRYTNTQLFPKEIYKFNELPMDRDPEYILAICLVAFLICILAGILPAYFAARLQPVEALRHE